MSGAGAIMDMTRRFKQNRHMLESRQSKRRELRNQILMGAESRDRDYYRDRIPAETLAAIKTEIREKYRKERQKAFFLYLGLGLVALASGIMLWGYFAGLY